jgi:N-acyl-D-amino-acid deacylase
LTRAIAAADRATWDHLGLKPDWSTFRQYFARVEKQGVGINVADYVGATRIRRVVIGESNRAPTPPEVERMKALVREAMFDGAVGLSTALQYTPGPYATRQLVVGDNVGALLSLAQMIQHDYGNLGQPKLSRCKQARVRR